MRIVWGLLINLTLHQTGDEKLYINSSNIYNWGVPQKVYIEIRKELYYESVRIKPKICGKTASKA